MSAYKVVTFDGDTQALSELVYRSWLHDIQKTKYMFRYTKEWLDWLLNAPSADRELQVEVRHKGERVAFFCCLPTTVMYRKREVRAGLATLITVAPEHRGMKLAWKMSFELKRRLKKRGYDMFYAFINAGRSSYQMAQKYIGRGSKLVELIRADSMVRVLDPEVVQRANRTRWYENLYMKLTTNIPPGEARPAEVEDLEEIYALLQRYSKNVELAKVWTMEDMRWYLDSEHSKVFVHEDRKGIDAMLCYSLGSIITRYDEMKTAMMTAAYLPFHRRTAKNLINYGMTDARKNGCAIMTYVDFGYLPRSLLRTSGFVSQGSCFSMFAQSFDGAEIEPIGSAYLEVR